MLKKREFKNDLTVCLIIGISFLMVGAEYITWWLYSLVPNMGNSAADILSEGVGYLFQALGVFIYALIVKKKKELTEKTAFVPLLFLIDFIFSLLCFLSKFVILIILLGFTANFLHGVIFGYYLTRLSEYGSKKHTGAIFGLGYAIATLITYLLSSVFTGSLGSPYIFVFYFIMGLSVVIADQLLKKQGKPISEEMSPTLSEPYTVKQLALAVVVVFLFSFVKNIGFYFPSASYISGAVDPILVRCIYAVGLILAGIINDKSRRYGSVCCLCALIFPFLVMVLNGMEAIDIIAWILGYFFFGFFSVYRVVVFTDISKTKPDFLYLAGFGMLFGRIGDSTSSMLGVCLSNKSNIILLLATLLFVITVFVYFKFYNQVYVTVIPKAKNSGNNFEDFLKTYDISSREKEILMLVLAGQSNAEIARKLFISESTVKFHIHNILKKTHTSNRADLIRCYENN